MDITRMKEGTRLELRRRCLSSLFSFCIAVLGYDDMTDSLHKDVCEFLQGPNNRKQLTLPRGFLKTSITSIAFPIWLALPRVNPDEFPPGIDPNDDLFNLGTNVRVLVASNVVTNACKVINKIKKVYERSQSMMALFPSVIPEDFTKGKWSDASACIKRTDDFMESTFEAAGVGGSAISRHYDVIIENDLIYAKKDDLTGKELQPDQDDIDKAIGWHKLATSLFVPKKHVVLINEGTRWAKHDLVDYIRVNEKSYKVFDVPAIDSEGNPTWPEAFDMEKLDSIRSAQGPYMFATQYLNKPMSPEDMLFKREWLQFYSNKEEIPSTCRIFTTVDLAGWGTQRRSRYSRAVVLTCGWDHLNHMWVLHYDIGRFDPSEVLKIMGKHQNIFNPEHIGVESVYYQESLVHFARRYMQEGKVPWMSIRQLKSGGEKKELRIRALEPIASNLALHCKSSHVDFIGEFCDYVPNNDACAKDILDAAAYQIHIARPGEPTSVSLRKKNYGDKAILPVGNIDDFLKNCWDGRSPRDRFGNKAHVENPYNDTGLVDWTDFATDPFQWEE